MRILFIGEYFHPVTPGGTPWSLRWLARDLVAAGHSVTIVTPHYGGSMAERVDGAVVLRFPFWRCLPAGPSLLRQRDLVTPRFHWRVARAVLSVARAVRPHVIHVVEKHSLVGAWLAARWLRVPVVVTLRDYGLLCPIATCLQTHDTVPVDCGSVKLQRECAGWYLDAYHGGASRWRRIALRIQLAVLYADAVLKRLILRRVDAVFGVSRSVLMIHRHAGALGHRPDRVTPNPVGSLLGGPAYVARVPYVLYVGKPSPGKGWSVFVGVARQLVSAKRVAFLAAGVDPEATPWPVEGLGRLTPQELAELYRGAAVVVHPSVWPEPMSRVLLEAASVGCAIVATRVGGTPEVIEDGVTGLLVPRGDAPALAAAITRLLDDPVLARRLGAAAKATVEAAYGPDATVGRLIAAYGTVGITDGSGTICPPGQNRLT